MKPLRAQQTYDLIVIGSGPSGQRAALQGAKAGKKVAIVEQLPAVGGGCVHLGTIPSKALRESIYRYSLSSSGSLSLDTDYGKKLKLPEMKRLWRRKDRAVSSESQVIFSQFKRNGISIFYGEARILTVNQVKVTSIKSNIILRGKYIFVAVGARPVSPAHIKVDGKFIHDSNSIIGLKEMPRSMVVLGAGIIGCEYSSMFSTAGTNVHLVDKRGEMLANVDREIVDHLSERFANQGMAVHLNCEATKIVSKKGKFPLRVSLSNGLEINTDIVLVAQGRIGNIGLLGLEEVGVQFDERGIVKVDKNFKTSVANIYAVGDVIGVPALASTSIEQGRIACAHAFSIGEESEREMPILFPYGIYTIPEISTLGLNEEECKRQKIDFVVGRGRYKELARGQIVGDKWGLLKLLVDRITFKLHGVQIIGDNAADLIHIGQAVMQLGGDVKYFIKSVFNYPTLTEAYKAAAFHAVNQVYGRTKTK